jgi:hypothetical protein
LKVAVCPALIVWEVDDPCAAPIVKSGPTVTVTLVLCESVPDAAKSVTKYVPGVTAVVALMVSVDVALADPEGVTDPGARLQLSPLTLEAQVNITALSNPFNGAMLTVEVADPPTAKLDGEAVVADI